MHIGFQNLLKKLIIMIKLHALVVEEDIQKATWPLQIVELDYKPTMHAKGHIERTFELVYQGQ